MAEGDCLITLEAARYRDVSVDAYLREYEGDLAGIKRTKGMGYSYGNFDLRSHYLEKIDEASAGRVIQAWQDYDLNLRPGRFKSEWVPDTWQRWAGIDCSALVQRCSDEVMESAGSSSHRYDLSDKTHLSSVRDNGASSVVGAAGILDSYTIKLSDNPVTYKEFTMAVDAIVGDVVGWPDGLGGFKHIALIYAVNRQTPGDSLLIHATTVPGGTRNGILLWKRYVQMTSWSSYSDPTIMIRRLRLWG